jgi:FRG domain
LTKKTPAILDKVPHILLDGGWKEFQKHSDALTDVGLPSRPAYLFRGQPDADRSLLPSFTRYAKEAELTSEQAIDIEDEALTEFTRQAHLHVPPSILMETSGLMGWWSLMQHYGAPTRFLDWTRSPFVAAYFAVASHLDKPGAIWVIHVATVRGRWPHDLPIDGGKAAEVRELCSSEAQEHAELHFVRRPRETDRMAAQQGYFSLSPQVLADHAELLYAATAAPDPDGPQFFRFIVEPQTKLHFLRRLVGMNVTARALFPGVDGLGRTIEELVRINSHFTLEP